jgi:hypothetical protein
VLWKFKNANPEIGAPRRCFCNLSNLHSLLTEWNSIHSYRSAVMGSTRVARLAGIQLASTVAVVRTAVIAT